jgi:mono/diheme cytochrome c family protein/cytochrome c553
MPVFMHHAPELSGIGDKLTTARTPEQAKAWLFDWLKEPRHYSAYTVMPRLRLSDQQAADLVEYLLAQKRGNTAPKGAGSGEFDGWQASEIKADQKKINELVSFFLRSQYSPLNSDKKAIDPKEMEARAIDALTFVSTATDEPRATDEDKAKEEAKTKAKARVAKMSLEQKQLVFLGSKLIAHYGCMNCHAINGMENAASPCANLSDWGQKQVSKLAFEYLDEHKIHSLPPKRAIPMVNGLSPAAVTQVAKIANDKEWSTPIAENVEAAWPQVEHTRTGWLTQKVLNSRVYDRGKNGLDPVRKMQNGKPVIDPQTKDPVLDTLADQELRGKPYDKLRMPTFYLNEEQAHAIVTFVISNRTRWISDKLLTTTNNEQSKRIAHGRQIAERYNCVGCHQVEANFPPVRQYYGKDVWATLTPPSLRGEGSKVQFDWLFNFLKNVELIRPNLFLRPQVEAKDGIRMPSFPVTDEETTALAAYFAAAANHESRELRQKLDNVIKYVDTQRKATTRPLPTTDKPWPGDDWIDKENFVQVRDELRQWVVSHELMLDSTFDPAKTKADEMKGKYREALYKARFILDLYDAPFPFVASAPMDQTDAKAADARFKKGEAFFTEMACLKCHYLGDLNASGGNNKPTAPNLALAHRRLQPRWLSRWVQEPPIIQVGTPMPPFFSGLSAFKLDGLPWPLGTASLQEDEDKLKQLGADADKVLAKYGTKDVRDQKTLLMDYLFTAGQKHGYTAMQPPDQATTAPATAQPSAPK